MPVLREVIANFLSPRKESEEKSETPTVPLDQEIAYSESLFNTGSNSYKYDPDQLKSRKGANIYSRMMIDEQVKAVVRFRRDAITGREFLFQFDDDVDLSDEEREFRVRLFKHIVEDMDGSFPDGLNAVMTGVHQGYSITEKVHRITDFEGKPYVGLKTLKRKPHDTFRFRVDEFGNVLTLEQEMDGRVKKVPIDKVIHYVQNPDVDEHYGGSELREAYRSWFSKDVAIKFWNIYLERAAGGVWVAKPVDGKTLIEGSREYNSLINILRNMSSSSSVLVPPGIELEHIQPSNTDEFETAVKFHDLSIAKALLVPNLLGISHTGQTGSFSQSQIQFKAFMFVLESDTVRLESALNEQVFRELGEQNFADGIYPKFKFKPLTVDQIIELLTSWGELVGKDAVEPSDTDEAHIRKLLDMPEKGEPITRRMPIAGASPSEQPGQGNGTDNGQTLDEDSLNDPDQLNAIRDRVAWKASFTRALKRVRFTVIDRKSQQDIDISVGKLSAAIIKEVVALEGFIEENRVANNAEALNQIKIPASGGKRFKTIAGKSLQTGWDLGGRHAQDEVSAARKKPFKAHMRRIEEIAQQFFDNKAFQISGNLTAKVEGMIRNVISLGIKYSWSNRQIMDEIYRTLAVQGVCKFEDCWTASSMDEDEFKEALKDATLTAHHLETVIRTNYFEAVNEARFSYFTDPEISDFVEALEYSAILDSRTTRICEHLDGRIFSANSPQWERYRPPNHYNCRSLLIAVTNLDLWEESREPTVDPQEGFG